MHRSKSVGHSFASVFNHIPQPSQIAPKADFHIFKADVEPKWEDPMNESGGIWQLNFRRDTSAASETAINDAWLHTVIATLLFLLCLCHLIGFYDRFLPLLVITLNRRKVMIFVVLRWL